MNAVIDAFRAAAEARQLILPEIQADGQLHRCDVVGRNGKGDGAYKLHSDGRPAGGFQNWQDGLGWENWRYMGKVQHASRAYRASRWQGSAAKRAQEAARDAQAAAAAQKAQALWQHATRRAVDPNHPYLRAKGVAPFGIGQMRDVLVIPLRDAAGDLHSLQFIDGEGQKRFLSGGRIGGFFHVIGELADGVIVIAEGYATAASIHMATGYPAVVAFNCGNLKAVALQVRQRFPQGRLVIAADDDTHTPGNPGLAKAYEAARHAQAHVALPKQVNA